MQLQRNTFFPFVPPLPVLPKLQIWRSIGWKGPLEVILPCLLLRNTTNSRWAQSHLYLAKSWKPLRVEILPKQPVPELQYPPWEKFFLMPINLWPAPFAISPSNIKKSKSLTGSNLLKALQELYLKATLLWTQGSALEIWNWQFPELM